MKRRQRALDPRDRLLEKLVDLERHPVVIQLARLADWPDEDDAPTWVRAAIWGATASEREFPTAGPHPQPCGLCQRPHQERAAVAALYQWPDQAESSTTALCPPCAARPTLDHDLKDALRQLGFWLRPVEVVWTKPDEALS